MAITCFVSGLELLLHHGNVPNLHFFFLCVFLLQTNSKHSLHTEMETRLQSMCPSVRLSVPLIVQVLRCHIFHVASAWLIPFTLFGPDASHPCHLFRCVYYELRLVCAHTHAHTHASSLAVSTGLVSELHPSQQLSFGLCSHRQGTSKSGAAHRQKRTLPERRVYTTHVQKKKKSVRGGRKTHEKCEQTASL